MIEKKQALEIIRTEYRRLDRITGVSTEGIILKLSSRLSRKLGYFQVQKKDLFRKPELSITIAEKILEDDALFLDVIRHEYSHAVVYLRNPKESHGHDHVWKTVCREVGCNPKATIKMPEDAQQKARPYKYIVVCSNCGAKSKYKTESKIVKIAEGKMRGKISCRVCNGTRFYCLDLKG